MENAMAIITKNDAYVCVHCAYARLLYNDRTLFCLSNQRAEQEC